MSDVFETSDLGLAEHILSTEYGRMRIGAHGQRRGLQMTQAQLNAGVRLDHLNFRMSVDVEAAALGTLVLGEVCSGRLRLESDGSERRMGPGDLYLTAQPEHPYRGSIREVQSNLAVIDPALVTELAGTDPGHRQQPLRFTGYQPVSAQATQHWKNTFAYVRDAVLLNPDATGQPLLAAAAARLLVATALVTFPHNALTDATIEDRRDSHYAALQRAVTFIDEHAHRDISVADIADAAHVTIRAVQLAFRRHLDMTPMDYLRRVRLELAHHELVDADPGLTTVTTVAYRWGFASPSRFALYYRAAYGVLPSHTLHQR